MEKVILPERVVCARSILAALITGLGLVVVLLFSSWVLLVAATRFSADDFRRLVFLDGTEQRRRGLPILRVFGREEVVEILTPVAGSDVDPRYRPQVVKAEWALKWDSWQPDLCYDMALAYWRQARNTTEEITNLERAYANTPVTDVQTRRVNEERRAYLVQNGREYWKKALDYAILASERDPANGFYRYTLADLVESSQASQDEVRRFRQKAVNRIPGNASILVDYAERLQKQGETQSALHQFERALRHCEALMTMGLCDRKGVPLGATYFNRIIDNFSRILGDYSAFASYIPDSPSIHHAMARWLTDRGQAVAAEQEYRKVLSSGEERVRQGLQTGVMLYVMSDSQKTLGNLEAAIELNRQALIMDSTQLSWWLNLGLMQVEYSRQLLPRLQQLRREGNFTEFEALRVRFENLLTEADEATLHILGQVRAHQEALDLRRAIRATRDTLQPS